MCAMRVLFALCALLVLPPGVQAQNGRARAPKGKVPAAPAWVTNKEAAYPNGEWLCFVEAAPDRSGAETAAMNALAQAVRVDVHSATAANMSMVSQIQKNGGKTLSQSAEFKSFAQELSVVSSVQGLMGVEKDFWNAPNGEVYAMARMNRAQCAARYAALIGENERLIGLIKTRAAEQRGSFDAYAGLSFAEGLAEMTDNFIAIRSVLRPETTGTAPSYGNAGAVKALAQEAARSITVKVSVSGDVDKRLEKALAAVFSRRGFKTGSGGYTLRADYSVEDAPQATDRGVFARFVLTAALEDSGGRAVLEWSESDREGHASIQEARQKALRRAETLIAGTDDEPGFAGAFGDWFASLL